MTGSVDADGRALLSVRLKHPGSGVETTLDAWIDTGFTGDLVMPSQHISQLSLPLGSLVQATLADGSEVELNAHTCQLDWFGKWKRIEVIANQGQFPLLGVGLLQNRDLHIDYRTNTMNLL